MRTVAATRRIIAPLAAALMGVAGVVVLVLALSGGPPAPAASGTGTAGPAVVGAVPDGARPVGEVLPPSPPRSISIPSIGVESPVEQVGLAADGALEVPVPGPLYDRAAWYRGSSAPGFRGPSVVLGHVDSAANGPSVFYDLGRMQPGQEISVTRADGITAVFRVDAIRSFAKDQFPSDAVYGDTDRAELRLITCGGDFDAAAGSYRDNTVVFAHLVGSSRT